jgi:hypothetical protein
VGVEELSDVVVRLGGLDNGLEVHGENFVGGGGLISGLGGLTVDISGMVGGVTTGCKQTSGRGNFWDMIW